MRSSLILPLGLCLGQACANIIFNHVPLTCDHSDFSKPGFTGCLRGMHCLEDGTCEPNTPNEYPISPSSEGNKRIAERGAYSRVKKLAVRAAYSTDGTCGPNHGNTICDPNSKVYTGTCCSSYGWCGNTAAHCGTGCVSGCTTSPAPPTSSTAPRSDGRCGKDFGGATCQAGGPYGGCCSSYGYCGSTTDHCGTGCQSGCGGTGTGTTTTNAGAAATSEPILGKPTTSAVSSGPATKDGTCGAANGNTVCGSWPQGSCCSMYGFCGSTTAHCGNGCQSGPCSGTPVAPAPGPVSAPAAANPGSLKILPDSRPGVQAGVAAMHAGLMQNGRVIFLDKVETYAQINTTADNDWAYSAEYDPVANTVVPLKYKTNAFCSGGAFLADGRWVSIGGNAPLDSDPTVGDGFSAVRFLSRSTTDANLNGQNWVEDQTKWKLNSPRWYASVQTMPDGRLFVASGSKTGLDPTVPKNNNPTWEILSPTGVSTTGSTNMTILNNNLPIYMYPFLHLLNDGNLFVFVSKSAEIFNVNTGQTVKALPDLPGDTRTYPNTGGSVLLPLSSANGWAPDIIICGGGAYQDITSPTDPSCGRMQPLSATPKWEMDSMPEGRGMVEGTLLPDGTVIWVNGCNQGAQGFGIARAPTLEVLIYDPAAALGQRWHTGPASTIARLYHSVALLLLDGTLMIAGSNPVQMPLLTPVPNQTPSEDFVTEYRIEIYTPPYLSGANANKRPTAITLSSKALTANSQKFTISFNAVAGAKAVKVALYHGGYVTHSLHMNHRMLFLDTTGFVAGATAQTVTCTMPPNKNVAQPGPYVMYVTVDGVPGMGQFVSVS